MGLKRAWRSWRLKRNTKKAVALLTKIDESLKGYPRWQRRQFWRDFVTSPESRKAMWKNIRIGK